MVDSGFALRPDVSASPHQIFQRESSRWRTLAAFARRHPRLERSGLIQGRLERDKDGRLVKTALKLRLYLRVPVPAHRKTLNTLRADLLRDVYRRMPDFPRIWDSTLNFLVASIRCHNFEVIQRLAKYTFDIFAVYATREIYRRAEYLWDAAK
ncbi:hypothetical protein B0H11DRAFT_1262926 [Mycena galericulata]|nr:hypothetical protein B0H11DRAFT_1262926 [Mycena galericulata]